MQPNRSSTCHRSGSTNGSSSSCSNARHSDVIVTSTPGTALSSWPEIKQLTTAMTVTPFESDIQQQRNRKRQRPCAPPSPSFPDLKLDFAGFELGSTGSTAGSLSSLFAATATTSITTSSALATTAASHPPAASSFPNPSNGYTYDVAVCGTTTTNDVLLFLQELQLPQDSTAAVHRLAQDGFDSVLALAFATVLELQHASIPDAAVVWQQARRSFQARQFQGPGDLSSTSSSTVSKWLETCGIPRAPSFKYAEHLCRLGYSSVRDLEFIVHDQRALSGFKTGHNRLVTYCVTTALTLQQQQQQQQQLQSYGIYGPNVYTAGSSSALLQPLDIQRDNEFAVQAYDSFLDALIEPLDVDRMQQEQQQQSDRYAAPTVVPVADRKSDVTTSDSLFTASNAPLRLLPQEHLQLLYEAVNLPRPNPCRRGKKIYWLVLASGGMKDDRFAPLTQFTGAELQNAYLRQFELPANSPVKMDTWSEENIRQLEYAVKDPRCRHLSKVCWEMLATGRTGVDEYAPLAKFTASQLRSRFRSLFGDKRPQKLRQKKQLLKLQQQHQHQEQPPQAGLKHEQVV